MDVGHSAYSQLQKLKGEEIVDTGDDDIKEFFSRGINEKTSVHDSKVNVIEIILKRLQKIPWTKKKNVQNL